MKVLIFIFLGLPLLSWAKPCGLLGNVPERIKDCNEVKGGFVLVMRSEKGLEIYQDQKSQLLWGDRIGFDFNHYGSQRACTEAFPESELLPNLKWRLPTLKEFQVASEHGMKVHLPRMEHDYWTSTPAGKSRKRSRRNKQPATAFVWEGPEGKASAGDLKDGASVRCVAEGPRS